MRLIDMSGQVYGRLTVLRRGTPGPKGDVRWVCVCECGTEKEIFGESLRYGYTISCGCFHKESITTHGQSNKTPEHCAWRHMKERCFNKNTVGYDRYGGRGITVCDEWKDSFETFFKDMGPRPSNKHSLDRLENDKNYTKENCAWRTPFEQSRNKSSNFWIERDGLRMILTDWAKRWGIGYNSVRLSIKRHGSFDHIYNRHEINKNKTKTRLGVKNKI